MSTETREYQPLLGWVGHRDLVTVDDHPVVRVGPGPHAGHLTYCATVRVRGTMNRGTLMVLCACELQTPPVQDEYVLTVTYEDGTVTTSSYVHPADVRDMKRMTERLGHVESTHVECRTRYTRLG